ncbi:hypothetical protein M406DRAFT_271395 [Cryphonectria parasitica EP155]|uniref:C2H2-type domain-containing protein n=1 Tax=Cryphonectria parasitica (strain ATCC 38755 / EP155) TaxID=660469 RepID=A0A9P4YC47_CRYP1|nr:uncharacterized protein M406DRAFT_271395 [Cryphonectria parasitica EP155]KAF3770279.1 hypothetical protein M406DRAFT_271395 [Cryphonectria parasitica EP155]
MERGQTTDFSNTLPSPYSSASFGDSRSEAAPADPVTTQAYATQPEARQSHYTTTATPTSEYSAYPASARSSSFPEHQLQRAYQPSASIGGASMASHSSSLNLQDGAAHQDPQPGAQPVKSDSDVPIDPSITAQSPTQYQYPQASPYGSSAQDMSHAYPQTHVYAQPRPDWTGYTHTPITPGHHGGVFPHQQTTPTTATPGRGNQVFSFVPIPGAQQHKRPRRRYEEIERMYKCGWNGCEKAYGTLNHLNAHVTMQSHGQKRVPEEFKEIRKEWKARKKAEEAERKQRDEAAREAGQSDVQGSHDAQQGSVNSYTPAPTHRLPPLGYQPGNYTQPSSVSMGGDYSSNYIPASGFPTSPYAQSHQQVYGQPTGGQAH